MSTIQRGRRTKSCGHKCDDCGWVDYWDADGTTFDTRDEAVTHLRVVEAKRYAADFRDTGIVVEFADGHREFEFEDVHIDAFELKTHGAATVRRLNEDEIATAVAARLAQAEKWW